MKRFSFFLLSIAFLSGCKSFWNYHTVPPNNNLFANAGETQVTGTYGTGGMNAQAGFAVTKNFSLLGNYGGSLGADGYHSKEGEFGIGFNTSRENHKMLFGVSAGYGLGNNFFQDSGVTYKDFRGSFTKPFVMLTFGSASIGSGKIQADAAMSLKLNYITYNGFKQSSPNPADQTTFKAGTFYYEPYFSGSGGGKHVRFCYGMGFAFKNLNDAGKGMRIYPFHLNMGILIVIGRKYGQ